VGKRRVTLRIDRANLEAAKKILGTRTIAETVDAALDEILKQRGNQLEAASSASRAALSSPT
jgi:Arc/MetJ family transcription regulator